MRPIPRPKNRRSGRRKRYQRQRIAPAQTWFSTPQTTRDTRGRKTPPLERLPLGLGRLTFSPMAQRFGFSVRSGCAAYDSRRADDGPVAPNIAVV